MNIPAFLLRHEVTVEPFLGNSSNGPLYGASAVVRCFVEEKTRLVRAPSGEEVTSSSTFYALLTTVCPAKSRVTLPSGRRTTVIEAIPQDGGGLPTPDHLEVRLM
ncbi:hypothetical protein PV728_47405 [Streptomyces europaeiscabiei]|uniref:hypothetical protein n=1 Tax=Streptomyces europaeiscabiei TaxID=146819 RepID=UPI0029A9E495|nr:hypothetical protein [Streptomyces europaeiscabiei]MDX3637677.1 hypothetical protein [Streptomyces europaeiscabiei]MDX3655508.1 hypothetical protein [Streptomyces europaeiscabiei]